MKADYPSPRPSFVAMRWSRSMQDNSRFVRIIGWYEEEYVRQDGRWLFRSLKANVEEQGEYQAAPTPPAMRGTGVL